MSLHFPNPVIDSNIGGCNAFGFVEAEKVNILATHPETNTVSKLVISGGNTFFDGYATWGTLRFEEKMEENSSGTYFSVRIRGFYPNLSKHVHGLFAQLRGKQFVVKITDNNLNTRLVGTPATPLIFTFDLSSGRSPSSRAGFEFSFSGRTKLPSPLID